MDYDKMYSSEVQKIKLDNSPEITDRYSSKMSMIYPDGDVTRFLRLHELKARDMTTDKVITTPIHYQYDPWRVAYDYYGDESLFWVILGANDLFSMFDLLDGIELRIPDPSSITGVGGLMTIGD